MSRHIEVQVFGDGREDCVILGERECSIQRRHQKVIEESPSPFVEKRPDLRARLFEVSRLLTSKIKYRSAGTIEYLVDDATGQFFFLEMNTRLQVEHGITELRFGIDLVEMMLKQAERPLDLSDFKLLTPTGSAIEARLYAENPLKNHMPSPGQLQYVKFGSTSGSRVDTWVQTGTNVSLSFDPLLAKVMVHGTGRADTVFKLAQVLDDTSLQGIVTNKDYLRRILDTDWFTEGRTTTNVLDSFQYKPHVMEIISPGSYTTIQDFPARIGIGFGIPEGGPMDSLHARLANCVVGNEPGCELLEITFTGPTIRFHQMAIIALAGSAVEAQIDGRPVPMYSRVQVSPGATLTMGRISDGCRVYLAVRGGFSGIPTYLGSKSTSPVVEVGGLQGRPLVEGDMLDIAGVTADDFEPFTLPKSLIPVWDPAIVYCLSGPHDSPDIMTPAGVEAIYSNEWTISHQASRIGVRLHGPQPQWARQTGGEGGSHPSNYLDYPYSIGAINWTGDSSVIFPADGPSLGGFITSHVIPRAELFKIGQLKPGDKFHFVPIPIQAAMGLLQRQAEYLEAVARLASGTSTTVEPLILDLPPDSVAKSSSSAIIGTWNGITIRQAGDSSILVELSQSLQLETRCKVQAIAEALDAAAMDGVILTTPIGCSKSTDTMFPARKN